MSKYTKLEDFFSFDSDNECDTDKKRKSNLEGECSSRKRVKEEDSDEEDSEEITDEESSDDDRDIKIDTRVSTRYRLYHGDEVRRKSIKLIPVLPNWILNPIIIPKCVRKIKEKIPVFKNKLSKNLIANRIGNFLPVQKQLIPWIFNQHMSNDLPQDAWISAPPGSGKTLSYVIPIIQILLGNKEPGIRCLVIVPSEVLASHVSRIFNMVTKGTTLKVVTVHDQTSFEDDQKIIVKKVTDELNTTKYEPTGDIVIITPEKLVKHLRRSKGFELGHLKFLVVIQADLILESVKYEWMAHIQRHLNKHVNRKVNYQKLLFSLSLTTNPMLLDRLCLVNPVLFVAAKDRRDRLSATLPHELMEYYMVVEREFRPAALAELISANRWYRVLCFSNCAKEAVRTARVIATLCPEVRVRDMSCARDRDLFAGLFSIGQIDVLTCTDDMIQGIKIRHVNHIISFDPPNYFQDYVERANRTGQRGWNGTVLTLVSKKEVDPFIQGLKANRRFNVGQLEIQEEAFQRKVDYFCNKMGIKFPFGSNNQNEKMEEEEETEDDDDDDDDEDDSAKTEDVDDEQVMANTIDDDNEEEDQTLEMPYIAHGDDEEVYIVDDDEENSCMIINDDYECITIDDDDDEKEKTPYAIDDDELYIVEDEVLPIIINDDEPIVITDDDSL